MLAKNTDLLRDALEDGQRSMTEKKMVFKKWYQTVCMGISVMQTLENNNYDLLYAYAYFTVILERMRNVVWYIFRYVLNVNEEIKRLELFLIGLKMIFSNTKYPGNMI